MGLIREPEGVDFIISGGPLSAEDAAEISAFIRNGREARAKAKVAREKLEAKALALPTVERTHLAYQLLSSLAAEESNLPEHAWAATAKEQFEQLHPVQSPAPARSEKKPRRRAGTGSATTKRRTPTAPSK